MLAKIPPETNTTQPHAWCHTSKLQSSYFFRQLCANNSTVKMILWVVLWVPNTKINFFLHSVLGLGFSSITAPTSGVLLYHCRNCKQKSHLLRKKKCEGIENKFWGGAQSLKNTAFDTQVRKVFLGSSRNVLDAQDVGPTSPRPAREYVATWASLQPSLHGVCNGSSIGAAQGRINCT